MSTSYPSNLSDAEWACLQRYLPPVSKRGRPPIHSLRAIFDAIFYVLRTGCPWRYLSTNFPPWQTVFSHFRRLRLKGTKVRVFSPSCEKLNANELGGTLSRVLRSLMRQPRENR